MAVTDNSIYQAYKVDIAVVSDGAGDDEVVSLIVPAVHISMAGKVVQELIGDNGEIISISYIGDVYVSLEALENGDN